MTEPNWENVGPTEPEGLAPVDVERRLLQLERTLRESVQDWKPRYKAFKDAEREYDQAFARAKLKSKEATNDKKYDAELETIAEREALDFADVEHKYSEKRLMAVHKVVEIWRSIGTSVREEYKLAGLT